MKLLAGIIVGAFLAIALLLYRLRLAREHNTKLMIARARANEQLETLQQAFHRFTPQDVVEDIIRRGVSTRGERLEATILFADLIGFTSMSERLAPELVVRVLNGYFQCMTQAISGHKGHVGKFIGDGILAMFGAPEPNPWHSQDAVRAALSMRAALQVYNVELASEGLGPIQVGVGLHRGTLVAGVIGSKELMEYTVIGDVVNTASRIEGLTRKMKTDILLSSAVAEALDDRFVLDAMPPTEVKGKAEPVHTFAVRKVTS